MAMYRTAPECTAPLLSAPRRSWVHRAALAEICLNYHEIPNSSQRQAISYYNYTSHARSVWINVFVPKKNAEFEHVSKSEDAQI